MDGQVVAQAIGNLLASVPGWSGRIFTYVPLAHTEAEATQEFCDPSGRINVWFINRVGFSALKYGEATRATPLGYRAKVHQFQVRGFLNLSGDRSEIEFQDLCDRIEERLSSNCSLGQTDHTVFLGGLRATVGYEMFMNVLCHTVTIVLEVSEAVLTDYSL